MYDVRYMRWLRRLSIVPRWSVVPVLRRQSVAEHSFHVTALAVWLVTLHGRGSEGKFVLEVMQYAMTHDITEAGEGDAPSPSKPKAEASAEDQVKVVVKCADILEALMFAYEEKMLGNQMGMDVIMDHLYNDFVDWWRYFDTGERHVHSTDVVQSAKLICFNPMHPHPAIEKEPPCLPLKSNG
jgi:hypothetical protein